MSVRPSRSLSHAPAAPKPTSSVRGNVVCSTHRRRFVVKTRRLDARARVYDFLIHLLATSNSVAASHGTNAALVANALRHRHRSVPARRSRPAASYPYIFAGPVSTVVVPLSVRLSDFGLFSPSFTLCDLHRRRPDDTMFSVSYEYGFPPSSPGVILPIHVPPLKRITYFTGGADAAAADRWPTDPYPYSPDPYATVTPRVIFIVERAARTCMCECVCVPLRITPSRSPYTYIP